MIVMGNLIPSLIYYTYVRNDSVTFYGFFDVARNSTVFFKIKILSKDFINLYHRMILNYQFTVDFI